MFSKNFREFKFYFPSRPISSMWSSGFRSVGHSARWLKPHSSFALNVLKCALKATVSSTNTIFWWMPSQMGLIWWCILTTGPRTVSDAPHSVTFVLSSLKAYLVTQGGIFVYYLFELEGLVLAYDFRCFLDWCVRPKAIVAHRFLSILIKVFEFPILNFKELTV